MTEPPRALIFEWVTAGGTYPQPPAGGSLLREGWAMRQAIIRDLQAVLGAEVVACLDARLATSPATRSPYEISVRSRDELISVFTESARQATYTLIIAPELDGELEWWVRTAESAGAQLISPGSEFVSRASDKYQLAAQLRSRGVAAVPGQLWQADQPWPEEIAFPAIVKPRRGAGCTGVSLLGNREAAERWQTESRAADEQSEPPITSDYLIQPFIPGTAVSIAALGDGEGNYQFCPPCRQRIELFSADEATNLSAEAAVTADEWPASSWPQLDRPIALAYSGGASLLDAEYAARAERLAHKALATLPPARGYVGLDLVLGSAPDGSQDFLIEINARLTTSYCLLSALSAGQIAAEMCQPTGRCTFARRSAHFTAAGEVLWDG